MRRRDGGGPRSRAGGTAWSCISGSCSSAPRSARRCRRSPSPPRFTSASRGSRRDAPGGPRSSPAILSRLRRKLPYLIITKRARALCYHLGLSSRQRFLSTTRGSSCRGTVTSTRPPGRGERARGPNRLRAAVILCLAMFLLAVPWTARPVAAGPEVLREAYAPTPWDNSFENVYVNQEVAQSFVARTDFLLTHLELFVFDQPNSGSDILQLFVATDSGNHPGSVIGSSAQQGVRNWTWVAFGFYPWVSLTAGQRYWIVAADSEPRPKGYEWATNQPGGYTSGEAQWYDANTGSWVSTGADLFFRVYGVSGPSLALVMEPNLAPVDPGASVPLDVYFNNSGNEPAATARIEMSLHASGYLNYTDSAGQLQATSSDSATVTVVVPVIRAQASAVPLHVLPGEALNFTVSFFNVGSGVARSLWLNASVSANLAVVGDDAAMSGAAVLGPLSWRFDNVSGLAYVFNVTVRADSAAQPGDRLEFRMDLAYTDGAGHPFGSLSEKSEATIHGPSILVAAATDKATPRPGDVFHVVLYLNNTGDDTASRVWLNATLPAW